MLDQRTLVHRLRQILNCWGNLTPCNIGLSAPPQREFLNILSCKLVQYHMVDSVSGGCCLGKFSALWSQGVVGRATLSNLPPNYRPDVYFLLRYMPAYSKELGCVLAHWVYPLRLSLKKGRGCNMRSLHFT